MGAGVGRASPPSPLASTKWMAHRSCPHGSKIGIIAYMPFVWSYKYIYFSFMFLCSPHLYMTQLFLQLLRSLRDGTGNHRFVRAAIAIQGLALGSALQTAVQLGNASTRLVGYLFPSCVYKQDPDTSYVPPALGGWLARATPSGLLVAAFP